MLPWNQFFALSALLAFALFPEIYDEKYCHDNQKKFNARSK